MNEKDEHSTNQLNLFCIQYVKYPLTTGDVMERLENELAEFILQPFRHFTYDTAHSQTLPSLHLHHSSFSNPSVTSPTSQLILQSFFRFSYGRLFTYVTWRAAHETNCSLTSLNYSRYRHYHKRTAMYCNCIVRDILNIAIFSHQYGALSNGWKS